MLMEMIFKYIPDQRIGRLHRVIPVFTRDVSIPIPRHNYYRLSLPSIDSELI